ncbi:hypothetical protein BC332_16824 [Capsicum chinense]|nr:hypothetical protein BC332_16824 [Capsicum chinense]
MNFLFPLGDGFSEGQFYQVLLFELDAIRKLLLTLLSARLRLSKFASRLGLVLLEVVQVACSSLGASDSIKSTQLGVSFGGGYLAGILCAIVSHPADNLVSFLNNAKGATVGDAVNKLGIMRLCIRGLPLHIMMIGTLTGAQWGMTLSKFSLDCESPPFFSSQLPTTGGAAAPAPAK